MEDRGEVPSIQPSSVMGSIALVLGFLTFVLLLAARNPPFALISSILAVIVGLLGLHTNGRERAGLGMVMGAMGGVLSLLLLMAIPM